MGIDGIVAGDIPVLLADTKYGILTGSGMGVWINSIVGEVDTGVL